MRSEPCGRYALSDGTLCSTHHGRFEGGWQGPPRCTRWGLAAAPVTDAGLDVERLTRAIDDHHDICSRMAIPECAPAIAAEYAALSRQAEKETA